MNFIQCLDNPTFPFLIIDNFYNSQEQTLIWEEIEFYYNQGMFVNDNKTGVYGTALQNGKPLAALNRIYLEDIYSQENRYKSNILNVYQKITSKEVIEFYKKTTPAGKQFEITNRDCTAISYYDNKDQYLTHSDSFMHTVILWFYKKSKKFKGGDFILTEPNIRVNCEHNRLIMFPSFYSHKVEEIQIDHKYRNKGLGRFSISHFYNSVK